jgi:hypothetical protein
MISCVLGLAASACTCSKQPVVPAEKPAALEQPKPDPALSRSLRGVWGSSASDVWAVGAEGTILHFDGKVWRSVPSGTATNLTDVSGSAPDDVWAVGENAVILHYDGKSWLTLEAGQPETTLLAVVARTRSEAWVGGMSDGAGVVRRYQDGKIAETKAIPGSTGIWRAWSVAPNDIWFVGTDHQANCFAMHRADGAFEHRPLEAAPLRGVFGAASNDVWVAAYNGGLHHWDGKNWTQDKPQDDAHWLGVWGTSSTDVWAFGIDGVVYHYDGKAWHHIEHASRGALWSAWGSAPNDVWFVGKDSTRLHWNGQTLQ